MELLVIILAIGITIFILCWWKFEKKGVNKTKLFFGSLLFTILLTPVLFIGGAMLLLIIYLWYPSYKFTTARWEKGKRYQVSENMIESNMLIGKTKAEVSGLLGYEGNKPTRDTWSYNLGIPPGIFNLDPDVLVISFSTDTVVSVVQHSD